MLVTTVTNTTSATSATNALRTTPSARLARTPAVFTGPVFYGPVHDMEGYDRAGFGHPAFNLRAPGHPAHERTARTARTTRTARTARTPHAARAPQAEALPRAVTAQSGAVAQVRCATCKMRDLCLPAGLQADELAALEHMVYTRKKIRRGENLFHNGDAFASLYAIRSGFFKTRVATDDGRDQVTGFHMAGELMGIDGIGAGSYNSDAFALEDSEVCVIPYARLEELFNKFPVLQRHFSKVMSREIVRDHGVMLLLGSMRAEERLATFLLNLSKRFTARGYSASEFILRMTREEIGSYLGLKLETVSRTFSKFQDDGLLRVHQKHIQIADIGGLKNIMGQSHAAA